MSEKDNAVLETKETTFVGQPEHKEAEKSPKSKKMSFPKGKRLFALVLGIVVVVIAGIIALELTTNNYKTPIKTMQKYANAEEYTLLEKRMDYSGRLASKQIKQIFKILEKSDYFLDLEEKAYDESIKAYEKKLDMYGDNFVITYSVVGYDELTKKDLRDVRSELQDYVYELESIVDESKEFSASDWGEVAEELGLMKAETKKLVEKIGELAEEYGRIDVSKGYEVSVIMTITGDGLDEPIEEEREIKVYRVNGRWVSYDGIGNNLGILDIL